MRVLKIFEKAASNLPKQQYRIWKDEFHLTALKSDKWLNEKMDYMYAKPVRKGFVINQEHWKYSSARNWLLNDAGIIQINKECL